MIHVMPSVACRPRSGPYLVAYTLISHGPDVGQMWLLSGRALKIMNLNLSLCYYEFRFWIHNKNLNLSILSNNRFNVFFIYESK